MEISRGRKVRWVELPRVERTEAVSNPFCGLYTIYRFCVWDEHEQGEDGAVIEDCTIAPGQTLALVEINLNQYRSEMLPPEALHIIERVFRFFRLAHVQMIVRFLYDWKGTNLQTEPRDVNIILGHMEQVAPLMRRFDDAIYIAQGLFVGNWGEMHSSRHVTENAMIRLYSKWSACVGPHTLLAVRSPALWRMLARSFEPPEDRTREQLLRLSLYNDGMLASETDFGTYGTLHKAEVKNTEDKMLREYEIDFQQKLCRFVPNGGEVVQPCSFNDVRRAVTDLSAMHVSYLNSAYDVRVYDKWKAAPVPGARDAWKGVNAFDYITGHLGYRYLLHSVKAVPSPQKNGCLTLTMQIENTGFSVCYRPLDAVLQVADRDMTCVQEYPIEADTLTWEPGRTITMGVTFNAAQFPGDSVQLRLKLTDPVSGACVQLANAYLLNAADGFCLLGMLEAV